MDRKVYSAEECPQELVEAILNAEPSLESEELNYLLDKARIAQ